VEKEEGKGKVFFPLWEGKKRLGEKASAERGENQWLRPSGDGVVWGASEGRRDTNSGGNRGAKEVFEQNLVSRCKGTGGKTSGPRGGPITRKKELRDR